MAQTYKNLNSGRECTPTRENNIISCEKFFSAYDESAQKIRKYNLYELQKVIRQKALEDSKYYQQYILSSNSKLRSLLAYHYALHWAEVTTINRLLK